MLNIVIHKREKLNQLLGTWPSGTMVTQSWLKKRGISRQLSQFYVKSGWIQKIGQGAFYRTGDKVDWMGGLYALQQQLKFLIHLGGRSLLELRGASHFVPLGQHKALYLYTDADAQKRPLPKWFLIGFKERVAIHYVPRSLFKEPLGLEELEQLNFSIKVSSQERALMEVLVLMPQMVNYQHAYLLFQAQETLRVSLVQQLLESCTSYKVKRLFLHFSKKCHLPWFDRLNLDQIDLGQGKRQIGEGGSYDSDYKISVPKLSTWDDAEQDIEV